MAQQREIWTTGDKVQVGHLMKIGGRVQRVIRLDPYPDFYKVLPDRTARIAVFDTGLEMTVIDGGAARVLEEA